MPAEHFIRAGHAPRGQLAHAVQRTVLQESPGSAAAAQTTTLGLQTPHPPACREGKHSMRKRRAAAARERAGSAPARADHHVAGPGVPWRDTWAVFGEVPPALCAAGDEAAVKGTVGAVRSGRGCSLGDSSRSQTLH